jgi:hypothetical protein
MSRISIGDPASLETTAPNRGLDLTGRSSSLKSGKQQLIVIHIDGRPLRYINKVLTSKQVGSAGSGDRIK